MKRFLLFAICFLFAHTPFAQAPFHRGVNLTGWFQTDNARKIQFRKFDRQDFLDIKSLGCDVIRLPVNLHSMTAGAPDYTLDPLFITMLDSAVTWAEELQIYLIIDNHSFDPSVNTSSDIGTILNKVWPQLANHYRNRSDYLLYEILNEPHGISDQLWGTIQQQIIDAIRSKDTRHTIIVGPSGYNSYANLAAMPVYTDTNLLYTFHFYDPFVFTHQGASWVSPSMEPLAGVPFPYDPLKMPVCPPSLIGSWIEGALNNYPAEGTVQQVKSLLNVAVSFRNSRHVNLFCGEFGVYIPNSDTVSRVFWYKTVREYLESKDIPWTTWDYKGGFGLFDKGSDEMFVCNLNVPLVDSLGLNVPPQHPCVILPDSTGFRLYDDFMAKGINDASWSPSAIDFYSENLPNNDRFCLSWSDVQQYNAIVFDFVPDRDLSRLVASNYALDLLVRGNMPGIRIDLRFVDTKTADPTDHPWRMRTTLGDQEVSWNGGWQHVHVPLKSFTEHGSWDNGTWYQPEGKFDWSAVDKFEIVAEYGAFGSKEVWFDNVFVTDQDTATVLQKGMLGTGPGVAGAIQTALVIQPNPMSATTNLSFTLTQGGPVNLSAFNSTGQKVATLEAGYFPAGYSCFNWNGHDDNGRPLPAGLYLVRISTALEAKSGKVIINKW